MAVDDEEELARPSPIPPILEKLSVADLHDYIAKLKAEIVRAEAEIKNKQSVRHNADALFKK